MDKYPDNNTSHEAYEDETSTIDLIMDIHAFHHGARIADAHQVTAAGEIGEASLEMEVQPFIVPYTNDEVVREPCDQLCWTPKPGSILDLVAIKARIPARGFVPRETGYRGPWNDVYIEIEYKDAAPRRFLLNSQGVVPYRNAGSIVGHRPTSLDDYDRYEVSMPTDLPEFNHTPLAPSELKRMLKGCKLVGRLRNR